MTLEEEKRIAFKISRLCHVRPSAVTVHKDEEKTVDGNRRIVYATVQSHKIGVLSEGEHVISMWYEVA